MKIWRSLGWGLALAGLSTSGVAEETRLLISAAASLRGALEDCGKAWALERAEGARVVFNFGGSGALAAQIRNGAPVDLFIAAGEKPVAEVVGAGLAEAGEVRRFLSNRLVLIAPVGRGEVAGWAGLRGETVRHVALGEPASVPAGAYAEEVLRKLELWDALKGRMVFAKDVRQVLTYVERGEAEAGVVYATDAAGSDRVRVVAVATEELHSPIVYPAVVLKAAPLRGEARAFLAWLEGGGAGGIFRRHGFVLTGEEAQAAPGGGNAAGAEAK